MRTLIILLLIGLCGSSSAYEFESRSYHVITDMDAKESKTFGKMMDAYYVFLSQTFGTKPTTKAKLPLRIYSNRRSFENYINKRSGRNWPKWVAGVYFYSNPTELVIHWDGSYYGIFYHEGFHQFARLCWPQGRPLAEMVQ